MSVSELNHTRNANPKIVARHARNPLVSGLMALGLVSLIFAAVPELDLFVSRLFWEPEAGFGFRDNSYLIAFRDTNRILPWVVIAIAFALLLPVPFLSRLKGRAAAHKLLFVVTFIAAGPGLGVQLIKMLVGRARPRDLAEFGGSATFTPPWEITDQCLRNCSFVSGEAASAFALLTLVVFIHRRYTTAYLTVVGLLAAAFSLNRVVFGGHFLSDVVIAWNVMFILAALIWRFFSKNAPQIDALFSGSPGRV